MVCSGELVIHCVCVWRMLTRLELVFYIAVPVFHMDTWAVAVRI